MSEYYSDPQIVETAQPLPPPAEHAAGESAETKEAIQSIKDGIFENLGNADDMDATDWIEERKDRDADERGETLSPEREKARLDRYQKALEAAGDEVDSVITEHLNHEEQHQDEIAQRDHAVARNTRHEMRVEQFERHYPDYRQTVQGVFSALPMGDHVAEALIESGRSAELAYAMAQRIAQHPDPIAVMNGINSMTPEQIRLDLARIEGTLAERDRAVQQQPPARRATKAVAPLRQVRGGSASPSFDASTASMEEYAARRKAGWKG
jgi:hypothetical protein